MKNNLLENIFSLKNVEKHKILTIGGIKVKFIRQDREKEFQKEINSLNDKLSIAKCKIEDLNEIIDGYKYEENKPTMAKVSIIITNYNKGKYIKEAVYSAINQTYENLEIICIDDASTDESLQILETLAQRYPHKIKLIKNDTNLGVIVTRNKAIDIASGDYILPLDGDDYIHPKYVQKAAYILSKRPEVGVVYCDVGFVGDKRGKLDDFDFCKDNLLYNSNISACSMFRKKNFIECGYYKNYMNKGCEDWDLWLSFYEKGHSFYKLKETLLFYRVLNNVETRTNSQFDNKQELLKQIIKNHLNLYLDNDRFIERIFNPQDIKLTNEVKKLKNERNVLKSKYKKYKKIYNIGLVLGIIIICCILHIFYIR